MIDASFEQGLPLQAVGPERWGRTVFNIRETDISEASPLLQRIVAAESTGTVDFQEVDWVDLQVTDPTLRARTVIPRFVVHHALHNGEPGEFNGYYIGEELHGLEHILLLLNPDDAAFEPRPRITS